MKELLTVKANVDRIMGYEEEKQTEKDHSQEQNQGRWPAHGFGLFGRESLRRLSLLSAHWRRTGTGSRVQSTAHRRLALDAVLVLCYPSSGRWEKRSIGTRSQLQNEAVHGGLGAAPSTSNLGYSRQRKSQVWPRWVPRGIACRFLVPRIYALSGGISSNEKRGRLHILLLIIRIF